MPIYASLRLLIGISVTKRIRLVLFDPDQPTTDKVEDSEARNTRKSTDFPDKLVYGNKYKSVNFEHTFMES